jgi:phosphonoacetate hydrolase
MTTSTQRRVVIAMIDGFGIDYFQQTDMPVMREMASQGLFKTGKAIFPTLTNANNISIACGTWPEKHGVTANCYYDPETGHANYLESADFLTAPSIFRQASERGLKSALLTCKAKTAGILGADAEISIAAEKPTTELVDKFGPAPPMYSAEINYWLWDIGLDILKNRPDIHLLYVHTTDYPMHMWPPEDQRSQEHLHEIDCYFGKIRQAFPETTLLVTADHGMNFKTHCWDLAKACKNRGLEVQFSVSPLADRLVKHHRGFGGVAYLYLKHNEDLPAAKALLLNLEGIEEVLARSEAASRFRLMPSRIGDLVVIPDQNTVFGDLPVEKEALESTYRSHGSLYESDIPLLAYNGRHLFNDWDDVENNLHLTQNLFR